MSKMWSAGSGGPSTFAERSAILFWRRYKNLLILSLTNNYFLRYHAESRKVNFVIRHFWTSINPLTLIVLMWRIG